MRKDERADQLVQLSFSFFTLSRVIDRAKILNRSLFSSISSPESGLGVNDVSKQFVKLARDLFDRYRPWISTIPLVQGISWEPTWKTLPNYSTYLRDFLYKKGRQVVDRWHLRRTRTSFPVLPFEDHSHLDFFKGLWTLWSPYTH